MEYIQFLLPSPFVNLWADSEMGRKDVNEALCPVTIGTPWGVLGTVVSSKKGSGSEVRIRSVYRLSDATAIARKPDRSCSDSNVPYYTLRAQMAADKLAASRVDIHQP
jgi:hypothetical protein